MSDMFKNIFNVINARQSVRIFNPDLSVNREHIYTSVNLAQQFLNTFVSKLELKCKLLAREDIITESFKSGYQPQHRKAPYTLVVIVRNSDLLNAMSENLIICGIFIECLLLILTSLGLGTLWISSFDERLVKKECSLFSDEYMPIAIIPIGYADKQPRRAIRRPVEERVQGRVNDKAVLIEAKNVNVLDYIMIPKNSDIHLAEFCYRNKYFQSIRDVLSSDIKRSDRLTSVELIKVLTAGCLAPSAKNLQSPEFVRVENGFGVVGNLSRLRQIETVSKHTTTSVKRGESLFVYLDIGAAICNMLLTSLSLGKQYVWNYTDSGFYEPINKLDYVLGGELNHE